MALVWVSGCSGAGKSFTGDYLSVMAGFTHIDGDYMFHSSDEEDKQKVKDLSTCFYSYWFDEKPAPTSLWHPYYQNLFDRAKAEREKHPDKPVVITHSVYNRECRDHIRHVCGDGLKFIMLDCPEQELLRRHTERFAKVAEKNNKTVEELYETLHKEPYTKEGFSEKTLKILRGLQPLQPDESKSFTLQVSSNDHTLFERLHRGLDLPPPSDNIPYKEIAAINYQRTAGKF
eukprot:Lithocolla_globosa_v1_NODE_4281_length_1472_cov_13.410727.p1 type:complete len:231 gc:universal NODE_4281_length_1472_cov_13.410727:742-1434(+)